VDKRPYIIALALFVLVVASWLLSGNHVQEYNEPSITAPDFFVEGLIAKTFDKKGQLSQRMTTEKLVHFPEDDSTEVTTPHFMLFDGDKPPWRVDAKTGWVSGDGELVLLQGGVTIDRPASKATAPVHIVAEDLRVQPKNNYLETDNKVNLTSLKNRVEATGMQAWFNKPIRIKLLADVRGRYEVE